MEDVGLIYNSSIQILICLEHGYCLPASGVKGHLQGLHYVRNPRLKDACNEVDTLVLADLSSLDIAPGLPPIPYLTIEAGFQCAVDACNFEKRAMCRSKSTVIKHLSAVHDIGGRRGKIPLQATHIREVRLQSLLPKTQYKPFLVEDAAVAAVSEPQLYATEEDRAPTVSFLQDLHASGQEKWDEIWARLPSPDAEQSDVAAPWLNTTGISRWIAGLQVDKQEILGYIKPLACKTRQKITRNLLVEKATAGYLNRLRLQATPGRLPSSINGTTARVLNSFEEGRIQSKKFHGVQEATTMQRYAKQWSCLIIFLLRIFESGQETPFASLYLDGNERLDDLVDKIHDRLHAMLAVDLVDIDLDKLFTIDVEDQDVEGLVLSTWTNARQHATDLQDLISCLSFDLVRFEFQESAFASPIIGFIALNTLQSNGAWIAAHNITFVLSGMIHCMQLWLLGYCYEAKAQATQPTTLINLVRDECKRFQINTTSTPMSELLGWRLLTLTASNDSVRHPATTVNTDCTQVTHLGIELGIGSWRQALQDLFHSAETLFYEDLLLGLSDIPVYHVASMVDTPADSRPGKCFIDDPRNQLHAVDSYLLKRLQDDRALASGFFSSEVARSEGVESSPQVRVRPSVVNTYLHANQQFLRLIAVLMYWTTGLPPRRKEFVQVRWCNAEAPRNLYILDGGLVFITGYHKSQWRSGTRPIARFLPRRIGDLLVRYLIYIPTFLRDLYHCMQYELSRGYLFCDEDGAWSPAQFGNQVKTQSKRLLGFQITSRQWRHIAIGLDRRLYAGRACKVYGVLQQWDKRALRAIDQSDSEIDPDYHAEEGNDLDTGPLSRTRNFQASHTPATGQSTYGNDVTLNLGLTDALLAAYLQVSQFWDRSIACFDSFESTASNHKRHRSQGSQGDSYPQKNRQYRGSNLAVRRQIWQWPVIEQALQRLLGPHAAPRNLDQRNGFLMVARSRPEALIILPTGSGKTLLFLVASQLPGAQVTVVIVPLIALRQDLRQRCSTWGIVHAVYDPFITRHELHAVPSILLVDIENAVAPGFLSFARALHAIGRLDRFILDEAHLLLTASHYRSQLPAIAGLRQLQIPFVCMTGTLPPFASFELEKMLYFRSCDRLRASSDRPNLAYHVRHLGAPSRGLGRNDYLLEHTIAACVQDIEQWSGSDPNRTARGICFVRNKGLGQQLAQRLNCQFYHGELPYMERERVVTAWMQGAASNEGRVSPFIVATSAFSAGVHYPSVRRVYHIDAPDGLLNYGQETGRAGRDGLHARCTVLLADKWVVSWQEQFHNNFLAKDREEMKLFLQFLGCRRQYLTGYLDGGEGIACNVNRFACDRCAKSTYNPVPPTISPIRSSLPISTASNHLGSDTAGDISESSSSSEAASTTDMPKVSASIHRLPLRASSGIESLAPVATPRVRSVSQGGSMQSVHEDKEPKGSVSSSHSIQPSVKSFLKSAGEPDGVEEDRTYNIAAQFARIAVMEKEETLAIYERQLATWGLACILCSFTRGRLVEGLHGDCIQGKHDYSLTGHRQTPYFDDGTACWRCAQPYFACNAPAENKKCLRPWLAFHASWVALHLDNTYGTLLLNMLGAPEQGSKTIGQYRWQLGKWLGLASTLGDRKVSNMARVSFYMVDRLEALCVQQGTNDI